MTAFLLLPGALVLILLGAELFTNGIVHVGHRLDLGHGAVGSVLAAVGTALPETMIPLVAIALGSSGGKSQAEGIWIGAILGAPFMLSTLAMFIAGLAVLARARRHGLVERLAVDVPVLGQDVRYFLGAYLLAVAAAFVPAGVAWLKPVVALVLLGLYAYYVRLHLRAVAAGDLEELDPLHLHRLDPRRAEREPSLWLMAIQVAASLALIVGGAIVFVDGVGRVAVAIGVDATLVSLIIAPIATELPEKFNSVIWIRQRRDTLAMGNVTGAMVFQSCIPTVVALVLAPEAWHIGPGSGLGFASAGIALVSTLAIFAGVLQGRALTGRRLLIGGLFYVGYLALVGGSIAASP